jgi:AraC-like DNA-binding protein
MTNIQELSQLIARHGRIGQIETSVAGLSLMVSYAPTEPIHNIYKPAFALIANGTKRTVLGNRVFDYGSGQYIVVSVELPVAGHVVMATQDAPFLAMGLTLDAAAIATLLLETSSADRAEAGSSGIGVSHVSTDILDVAVRMLRLLDRPRDVAVLRPLIERELLWRLLEGEQGTMIRQIGLADSKLSQIGQAIRWLRAHYAEMLRVEELAHIAAMSVSSFHRHFRAATAMSPIQYQKRIRLHEARARLLADVHDVAVIGFEVGYDSPSQFSREYRRLFGMPPGRDALRLRPFANPEPRLVEPPTIAANKAAPRRQEWCQLGATAPNMLDRSFQAPAPIRKSIADFTYIWTAEGNNACPRRLRCCAYMRPSFAPFGGSSIGSRKTDGSAHEPSCC